MKVLVINSGSSSLKYQFIETKSGEVISSGNFERIGEPGGEFSNHSEAISKLLESVPVKSIEAIGHRVVHGGEIFNQSTLATESALKEVEKLSALAPLHNPANITGIRACMKVLPKIPNVMVFDTAFHSTMPKKAFLYALPLDDYNEHKIRRYGFHGTSHNYVARKAAEMAGADISKLRIITCHIGNGCSVSAIEKGKSIETSLGLTPLEGLIMGTRCGDIDAAVVEVLCDKHQMSVSDCIKYLNKKSGLLGLSQTSNDMRDLMQKRKKDERAQTAIDCFVHRITKYIGAFTAVMNGVDIIVWTGGIGNNNEYVRSEVMKNFGYIGADIDLLKSDPLNGIGDGRNVTRDISALGAKVKTFVICTNEELEIATETEKVVK